MKNPLIILVAALLIAGCATIKDNHAFKRIVTRPELAEKTYAYLVKQHPIKIDTVYRMVAGKEIITYDTTIIPVYYVDTIINQLPAKIKIITNIVTKHVLKVDTLVKTIQDDRLLNAAGDRITVLETQLTNSQASDATHKKAKLYWILAFSGMAILFMLGIYLVITKAI